MYPIKLNNMRRETTVTVTVTVTVTMTVTVTRNRTQHAPNPLALEGRNPSLQGLAQQPPALQVGGAASPEDAWPTWGENTKRKGEKNNLETALK
jgi:hypothetical protein